MQSTFSLEKLIRLGVFLTFVGHGVFAISGKPNWIYYLEFVGFSNTNASSLIKWIGFLDILIGLLILLKPSKIVVIWAVFWTFLTALIRPLAGESIWEFVERGANWVLPLSLYILKYSSFTSSSEQSI